MTSNVFPMLSSSPPPLDDCPDDDDEDDEFGNFASANIPFDSSFDSPVVVDKLKQFKSGDNGLNDDNISNEIKHFNAFNSSTNSLQEIVPNFPDENEHSKNGFIPIKHPNPKNSIDNDTDMKDNSICNQVDITSHKSVACVLNSFNAHINDSEQESEYSGGDQNSPSNITVQNNLKSTTVPNFAVKEDEFCVSQNECISPCDLTREITEMVSDHKNGTHIPCDDYNDLAADNVLEIQFTADSDETEKYLLDENDSVETFACDFNFHNHDKSSDEFNYQPSEHDFAANVTFVNSKISDYEGPIKNEVDIDEVICESTRNSESKIVCDVPNNEFDDFQGCDEKATYIQDSKSFVQTKCIDDFEYDDFQEFQYSNDDKKEMDEFADFCDFSKASTSDMDDFAEFSAAPFASNKVQQSVDNSEFADFEEAAFNSVSDSSFQASSFPQKNNDTLSAIVNAVFPLPENLSEGITSDELSPHILEQSNKSRRLWEKLHEVEQAPSLRFQWGVSHSFQQLLRSVNVDYHSILRTSSVPIFASGLSLLEPVKGLSNSVNIESEDRNQALKPKDPIPPVEFDWNSSGLVNPLDCGPAASTLMDLSFLSSVETNTSGTANDYSFESELLKPSPAVVCPENNCKTQILEQLLSKNISSLPSSKLTRRPSDLSHEAIRVLDQLPDLSFMQAKVLMFPISSKT